MSAYEISVCRHCRNWNGNGCIHCDYRGYFSRRLRRRGESRNELARILALNIPPANVIPLPAQPQEAA